MITLEQAKSLCYGDILHEDKTCRRWKVNGMPKTWKTRPGQVKIPVKFGLYNFDYVTENELDRMHLEQECPE